MVLKNKTHSVSEFISVVKEVLESGFSSVQIEGEVSNLSFSSSGHVYFSLVDETSLISAALFKSDFLRNPSARQLKDGMKVLVSGGINVYPKKGTFQIIVRQIFLKGQGDLKEKFDLLKKKLSGMGLFDLDKKRVLPAFPKKIAIITAPNGAAVSDFVNIYKRRGFFSTIIVVPALVQGEKAPASIINGLEKVLEYNQKNSDFPIEVLVLARGGGSLEDLWAFNDERLALKFFNFPIPTISAIGHEIDFSITDFVADVRAETPSAAAELLTKHQVEILGRLEYCKKRMHGLMRLEIGQYKSKIEKYSPQMLSKNIWIFINKFRTRIEKSNLNYRAKELLGIPNLSLRLDDSIASIRQHIKINVQDVNSKLESSSNLLNALNPKKVLERGYLIARTSNKSILESVEKFNELEKEDEISLIFHDGAGIVRKI